MVRAYISGALTSTRQLRKRDKRKRFYEKVAKVCEKHGFAPYLPHLHTDPILHPERSPREVYDKNRTKVFRADILIAYVGAPSLGVGSELELANQKKIPIILLYESNKKISRHIRGIPFIVKEIQFSGIRDCMDKLSKSLDELKSIAEPTSYGGEDNP